MLAQIERLKVPLQQNRNQEPNFLEIPIGTKGRETQYFAMGDTSKVYGGLLGGVSQSGKSTFLNNLILQIGEKYAPNEIRLWLMDFKEGVEFIHFKQHPNVQTLIDGGGSDKMVGVHALQHLQTELAQRAKQFIEVGAKRINEFNKMARQFGQTNAVLPRIFVIIDEVQVLFTDRQTKIEMNKVVNDLVRRGAAFGIHLLLSSQSFKGVDIDDDSKDQLKLRMAFTLANSMDCRKLMGTENDAPLSLEPYHAIINTQLGQPSANTKVKMDYLPADELKTRLQTLMQKPHGYKD